MRERLLAPLPALSIAALIVVAATPAAQLAIDLGTEILQSLAGLWNLGWLEAGASAPEVVAWTAALLPIAAILYWSARRPGLLPVALVFVLGLSLDVAIGSQPGVWTSAALVANWSGRRVQRLEAGAGPVLHWARQGMALAAAAAMFWTASGFASGPWPPALPLLAAVVSAAVLYVPLAATFTLLDRLGPGRRAQTMFSRAR